MTTVKKTSIPKELRDLVWLRYVGKRFESRCFCGCRQMMTVFDYECGHVIAESKGGPTTIDNLRPIRPHCNRSMATMDLNEYRAKYFHDDNACGCI